MSKFKDEFLLDQSLIYLNHGSFGACPKPVFRVYQDWQQQLETQPVRFLGRQAGELMQHARAELANYLNVQADNLVYFPNPTSAINMVARSLDLQPGDEILATNHEYGAMERTWRYICSKTGAKYVPRPIRLPVSTPAELAKNFLTGITAQTRVIFISHITSPTALIFPVREICIKARQLGIITIIDGAHAPGQVPLDLQEIGADIYAGACHKWLCAPKGSAFLYAHPTIQPRLEPLIVSWGYQAEVPGPSQFIDYHEWQGTRDLAAYLAVPAAIQYQAQNNWDMIQRNCFELALEAHTRGHALTRQEPLSPPSHHWFQQMVSLRLPPQVDYQSLGAYLYQEHHIEVLTNSWQDQPFLRVSFQAYNQSSDLDALLVGLETYFAVQGFF